MAFLNPQKGIHRSRAQRGPAALSDRCAVCQLRESASWMPRTSSRIGILRASPPSATASRSRTIHHRAYDHDLVGISPDYRVHVARRLAVRYERFAVE